jgi:hypothetical protein
VFLLSSFGFSREVIELALASFHPQGFVLKYKKDRKGRFFAALIDEDSRTFKNDFPFYIVGYLGFMK